MGFHFAMKPAAVQAQSKCLPEGLISPYTLDNFHSLRFGTLLQMKEARAERDLATLSPSLKSTHTTLSPTNIHTLLPT